MRPFSAFLFVVAATLSASAQTSVTLNPAVITQCDIYGLHGKTSVTWTNAPDGSQVRLSDPSGKPFTGPLTGNGAADTGVWVADGLVFILADSGMHELARATATVICLPPVETNAALAASSYFPLQVGNEWVYTTLSRFGGPFYSTQRVSRVEVISGVPWFVVSILEGSGVESRYRVDNQGRVHLLNNGVDEVYLDPSGGSADLKILGRGPLNTLVGQFPDSLSYQVFQGGLQLTNGTFVRGLGPVSSSSSLETGSSGGFTQSLNLIYARIGKLVFSTGQPSLELSPVSTDLDVTGKNVDNCALPCYFVACGIAFPNPDPPGTYKPCFRASVRVAGGFTNSMTPATSVVIALLDASGNPVDSAMLTLPSSSDTDEAALSQQLKLYTAPNVPVPTGAYSLKATLKRGDTEIGSSTISVNVR